MKNRSAFPRINLLFFSKRVVGAGHIMLLNLQQLQMSTIWFRKQSLELSGNYLALEGNETMNTGIYGPFM